MRFSRSESVVERSEDNVLRSSRSKKKHKRLDAICENVYTRNHSGVEKRELLNAGNVDGDGTERRRSTRVRRAPEVLDASPLPPKKRRRIDKRGRVSSVDKGKRVVRIGVKNENSCSTSKELEEEEENLGSWRSRLRTRGKSVSLGEYGGREKGHSSPKGRRKLFQDFDGVKEEGALEIKDIDIKEEFLGGDSCAAEGKIKVLSLLENEQQQVGLGGGMVDEKMLDEEEMLQLSDKGNDLLLKTGEECGDDDDETKDGLGSSKSVEKEQIEVQTGSHLEEHDSNDSVQLQADKVACIMEEHPNNALEVDGATADQAKVEETNWKPLEEECGATADEAKVEEANWEPLEEECGATLGQTKVEEANWKPLEEETSKKFGTENHLSNGLLNSKLKPIRIKEGRRCGLCGGGTDGKPPKKLVQDGNGTDDEASSGGSASEEPNYDIWDGFGDELGWLGRLLGPVNDRYGIAGIWVHQQCAVWSPEVYFAGLGCLKNVRAALCRGRVLKCTRCGRPGATIGCRVDRCPKTYHLPCARASGCIFDHRKFLIACTDHRHIFQPQGSQYFLRLKKMKLKKKKMEIRKMSNDALRKDIESEEKWLEQCGEDEEFLKREGKRLHRDLLRIAPTYIGGSSGDSEIQFQGWESVAGLRDVIQCMKEVVILPLLYPEFFGSLGLTPPRGVLLHGYPGTGKTLVVRALIGSCARGDKRIAYFARKGADCLGKYVGDAERQLRLLFQVAEKSQPSIIFFDEIDGLAPCRTRQQDQTHSSVVSTLLALMDGLKSRGSVVVIGATNRPDAIDPALRRPGRFDREIYFPLPSTEDREAILAVHTQKWPKQISGSLLKWVARRTVGFAGADLQALCTQAAIIALRRNYPLHELLAGAGDNACMAKLHPLPSFNVEERDWLDALSSAPPPCSHREAGIAANDLVTSPLPSHLIPCLVQPLSKLLVSLYLDEHVWLPPPLYKAATVIKNVVISALDGKKVVGDNWGWHLHDFLQDADIVGKIQDSLLSAAILTDAMDCDALEDVADDRYLKVKPSSMQCVGAHPSLLHTMSHQSGTKPGFRILISGEARWGQRHLASCILHYFSGNIEIRKLDLATFSQEGHGDVVNGLTLILMRCASFDSCMLFLPRIDLWAAETCIQSCEGQTASPSSSQSATVEYAENSESQDAVKKVSYLWNSFVEQVESICVQTPLMILATSEVPFVELPSRVKQFFRSEILDCALLNPWKDSMPRFLVEVDQHLNYDSIIDTSATKLLMDLVQYFIHLSRHCNHANSSSQKKYSGVGELSINAVHQCSDPMSKSEPSSKHPIAPVTSVAACNPLKGKSNLLAAISTFGYQILRYPHFAELCWVTSKLKQGPCTHINGPWKGWPFNSCILRPLNSTEGVAFASSSNAAKNMDKSGVVRGLIAVALSAYRGEYTSLREFSLEIRKVLELLVALVETKIQAGKDKYKFLRLLSQVAYFEDMVISWAYTLRSLEVDAQFLNGSPSLAGAGSFSNQVTCNDSLPERSGCKQTIPNEVLHEPEGLVEISQAAKANHIGDHTMADDNLNLQNGDDASVHKEDSSQGIPDHSSSVEHMQSHLQNGIGNEPCMLIDAKNPTEIGVDEGCNKHPNGFAERDSSVLLKHGPGGFGDKHGMELSDAGKIGSRESWPLAPNGTPFDNAKENSLGCSPRMSMGSTDAVPVCMYYCCTQCLVNLYQLLLKLLNYEWRLKGSTATVEDFHDFVASLTVNLQSAARKLFATDSSNDACDEKLKDGKYRKYSQCTEMCTSQLKSSGKRVVVPMECGCHSASESITTKARFLQNSRHGFDFKYVFKDGVLVTTIDTDYKAPFHCKFEKLCLCSLLQCIVTAKDPSD